MNLAFSSPSADRKFLLLFRPALAVNFNLLAASVFFQTGFDFSLASIAAASCFFSSASFLFWSSFSSCANDDRMKGLPLKGKEQI
jgi:hypothetical protein